MLTRKKKIFILAGMVVLLVATAILNFQLAANADKDDGDDYITTGSFFMESRSVRESTRSEELAWLDSIIETTQAEYSEQRQTAMDQKLKLINNMDQEMNVEQILKGKGYEDVIVTMSLTADSANIIVKAAELTRDDYAVIYNAMYEQTGLDADDIRIIPIE
ncbi:MAG: SpoIIIAH-like family protein [Clostridia bacterium]|nr:SpoIIIAH-like family protein [Clostridia bacterium]